MRTGVGGEGERERGIGMRDVPDAVDVLDCVADLLAKLLLVKLHLYTHRKENTPLNSEHTPPTHSRNRNLRLLVFIEWLWEGGIEGGGLGREECFPHIVSGLGS